MKNFFKDKIIKYLISNQAPKNISYSSNEENKVFGFWLYLGERGESYVIQKRLGVLKYECLKVDAPKDKAGARFTKYIEINKGYSFSTEVNIKLFYNSYQINDLTPLIAYFLGVTRLYIVLGWLENYNFRNSVKKNEKAYSLYCDRLRLLELLIDIRNKQHEDDMIFSEKITHDTLIESIARASVVTSQGYYGYIEPILKGLREEGAITIGGDDEITIEPTAWRLVSEYYVDERRHKDNQNSLKWQRILTSIFAIISFGNIFKDEIRAFFGL